MRRGRAVRSGGRWGEVLLGSALALGAPAVVRGLARSLGMRGVEPGLERWAAGVLGALVGGGLARRRGRPPCPETPRAVVVHLHAQERVRAEPSVEWVPRRGPSGRERLWLEAEAMHPA